MRERSRSVVETAASAGIAGRPWAHAALYLMGDGPRGIPLELVPMARIVRLARLR
ncbi:MAG TPA: hypothetical protein VF613_05095 [Longimicrobium sp.]|jgi:hypothetical protein